MYNYEHNYIVNRIFLNKYLAADKNVTYVTNVKHENKITDIANRNE